MGFLTALPPILRFCQCIRRYRDTKNIFPHLVNCGKYTMSIMAAVTLSVYRIDGSTVNLGVFVTFATINAIYCCKKPPSSCFNPILTLTPRQPSGTSSWTSPSSSHNPATPSSVTYSRSRAAGPTTSSWSSTPSCASPGSSTPSSRTTSSTPPSSPSSSPSWRSSAAASGPSSASRTSTAPTSPSTRPPATCPSPTASNPSSRTSATRPSPRVSSGTSQPLPRRLSSRDAGPSSVPRMRTPRTRRVARLPWPARLAPCAAGGIPRAA
ncbi:EXS family-domain-containing protein [Stachybotrys elegans]|uniref:EXS family-domain-containing protein n=1 Tax=Stachybotrys elegans TaxID=80388 RepID=A0A8K0SRE5_9HYPO|nr:EXS family-domain-containing protein [Stachybotrys elegans]